MILKIFKIKEDKMIKDFINHIDNAIKSNKLFDHDAISSKYMTTYNYFSELDGREVFDVFKNKYLPEFSISECWGVKNEKNDEVYKHNHLNVGYKKNQGTYEVSGLMYLTDSEDGTHFNDLKITEKAEKGKVVLFTSNEYHSVPKIKDNNRYVISFNGYNKYNYNSYRSVL